MSARAVLWISSLLLTGGASAGAFVVVRGPHEPAPIVQPIRFNHEKHVLGKPKLSCLFCHPGVERETHAGLPPLSRCLSCHMKPQSDSPNERVVRALAASPEWPRFTQVTRNDGHVSFPHSAHVGVAKMQCSRCHGDVSHWTEPPSQPTAKLKSMTACLECHRTEDGPTRCTACHR